MKEITAEQLKRTKQMLDKFAGEDGKVEACNHTIYWYGSEIGMLRIMAQYRKSEKITFGYSKNLQTHYFSLWF